MCNGRMFVGYILLAFSFLSADFPVFGDFFGVFLWPRYIYRTRFLSLHSILGKNVRFDLFIARDFSLLAVGASLRVTHCVTYSFECSHICCSLFLFTFLAGECGRTNLRNNNRTRVKLLADAQSAHIKPTYIERNEDNCQAGSNKENKNSVCILWWCCAREQQRRTAGARKRKKTTETSKHRMVQSFGPQREPACRSIPCWRCH